MSLLVIARMRPRLCVSRAWRHDRPRGLERIALRPVFREEGKPDIRVGQRVALQHAAHAELRAVCLTHDAHQAIAVARVAGNRAVGDVPARGFEVMHAAVADVAPERGLVQQAQHEVRVVRGERMQLESLGVEPVHWCSAQKGSTVRSTKDMRR